MTPNLAARPATSRGPIALASNLAMPLDAVTHTFGIFGQKGSGKTTTAAVMVEQMVAAGGRAVVFDPTGVWYGLTREGTGPGLPGVVLGGEHADAPLEPKAGMVVAEFVMASDYPLVVLDMKLLRKHHRQSLAMDFLETLYHDNREPLMVVIDESPQFAPQVGRGRGGSGDDAILPRLVGAVEDVITLGRSRGLGGTLIAQRFAMVNANVREQVGTLVSHRLVGKLDRNALGGWIEANGDPEREKEVLGLVAKLDDGQALVWSPAFLHFFGVVGMNNATTFDSRATPRVGQRVKKIGKRTPVDLDTLRDKMAATIEEARANDPKELRRMNAELAKKLAEAQSTIDRLERASEAVEARVERIVEEVRIPVFAEGEIENLGKIAGTFASVAEGLSDSARAINTAVERAAASVVDRVREAERAEQRARRPEPSAPTSVRTTPPRAPSPVDADYSNGALTNPEQRVVDAVRWYGILGNSSPSKQQVGFIAGYRVGKNIGGTFGNLLGRLRAKGYLEYPTPGSVRLTAEGEEVAHDLGIERSDEAVQDAVLARLNSPEQRVLSVLIEAWPDSMRKQDVGAAAGYTVGANIGGTFGNILGRLRSLGVVAYPTPGEAVATDVLFPLRSGLR